MICVYILRKQQKKRNKKKKKQKKLDHKEDENFIFPCIVLLHMRKGEDFALMEVVSSKIQNKTKIQIELYVNNGPKVGRLVGL